MTDLSDYISFDPLLAKPGQIVNIELATLFAAFMTDPPYTAKVYAYVAPGILPTSEDGWAYIGAAGYKSPSFAWSTTGEFLPGAHAIAVIGDQPSVANVIHWHPKYTGAFVLLTPAMYTLAAPPAPPAVVPPEVPRPPDKSDWVPALPEDIFGIPTPLVLGGAALAGFLLWQRMRN